MQILEITRQDFSLYCPFTGAPLLSEKGSSLDPIKLPSVQAVWIDEVIDEPQIEANQLLQAWELQSASILEADDLPSAMNKFLANQDLPDHIAIRFCHDAGMISSDSWIVLSAP